MCRVYEFVASVFFIDCHNKYTLHLQKILNDLTNSMDSTTVMVTGLEGDNVCEQTACLPNPCQNGGLCRVNDEASGGYVCDCTDGYTGTDCMLDVDECLDGKSVLHHTYSFLYNE